MTARIEQRGPRYCECGCGRQLGTNLQQLYAPPCRALRRKAQSIASNVRRSANPGPRLCACGEIITTKNAHFCDSCRIAKALAKLEPNHAAKLPRDGVEMRPDYPQVEQFKPWVRKNIPLTRKEKDVLEAAQKAINAQCWEIDLKVSGFKKDNGRSLTPAEIAAVAGSITHISQIPWEGGPVYGVGELAF